MLHKTFIFLLLILIIGVTATSWSRRSLTGFFLLVSNTALVWRPKPKTNKVVVPANPKYGAYRSFPDGYMFIWGDSAGYDFRHLGRRSIYYLKRFCNAYRYCRVFNNWGWMKYYSKDYRYWSLPYYNRHIYSFLKVPRKVFCDGNWLLVRRVAPGRRWHPARDNLWGTHLYGTYVPDPAAKSTFSMIWSGIPYHYIKMSSGDGRKYVILHKYWPHHRHGYTHFFIDQSHRGRHYWSRQLNRWWVHIDPFISAVDHHLMYPRRDYPVYAEGSNRYHTQNVRSTGANVWIHSPYVCPIGRCTVIQPDGCASDTRYTGRYRDPTKSRWDAGSHETVSLCLRRAQERHKQCKNEVDNPTVTQWNKRGELQQRAVWPEEFQCVISQKKCNRYPKYKGDFRDKYGEQIMYPPTSIDELTCLRRAKQYHIWCRNSMNDDTIATFKKTGKSRNWPGKGCWISQGGCTRAPAKAGYWRDIAAEMLYDAGMDPSICLARARFWYRYCGNPPEIPTIAYYLPTEENYIFPKPIKVEYDISKYVEKAEKAAESVEPNMGVPTSLMNEAERNMLEADEERKYVELFLSNTKQLVSDVRNARSRSSLASDIARVVEQMNDYYSDDMAKRLKAGDDWIALSQGMDDDSRKLADKLNDKLLRAELNMDLMNQDSQMKIMLAQEDNELKLDEMMDSTQATYDGMTREYNKQLSEHDEELRRVREKYSQAFIDRMNLQTINQRSQHQNEIKRAEEEKIESRNEYEARRRLVEKMDYDDMIRNQEMDEQTKEFNNKLQRNIQKSIFKHNEMDRKRQNQLEHEHLESEWKAEDQLNDLENKNIEYKTDERQKERDYDRMTRKRTFALDNQISDLEDKMDDYHTAKAAEWNLGEIIHATEWTARMDNREENAINDAERVRQLTDCARCESVTCKKNCMSRSKAASYFVSNPNDGLQKADESNNFDLKAHLDDLLAQHRRPLVDDQRVPVFPSTMIDQSNIQNSVNTEPISGEPVDESS